mmetsp:Transcript_32414/g.69022  ORF Transcript_32414/g.69022 Transcript_32414/m.69022 type:complete len:213 (-) Transcript_32414:573-1211(-)|eukprot:CAMPEP_0172531518 /NCGR_PEP_ID=MMETSP1067-20121228/4894_1 /TAXON_ID=265564 ORGANISM="Thalassiosira punctigera, Strain Tpunct2005C2" /NCGR_SAMPLE_ID=MMETSP1067 /ASSEMBLY_ACC=CAM_ASM_000444 /LENGTH=212 /DNA_ID=CAMNT_0013315907 /DNA_START=119 /DNA_END=757 /DNA_ORIENTATION=-
MILRLCQSAARTTLPRRHAVPSSRSRARRQGGRAREPQARWYLGGAGEARSCRDNAEGAVDDGAARREQALWDRARPRYDAIMERHVRLPVADGESEGADAAALDVRRKRLVYRSKQRGWLEVDLLLGTWAAENVRNLSGEELDEFERFVNLETIDIYNVLTLRVDVPEELRGREDEEKSLVEKIQDWAKECPLGKADRERYAEAKARNNLI